MVSSNIGRALVEAHRRQQIQVGREATLRLLMIASLWSFDDLDATWPAIKQSLLSMLEVQFGVSAAKAGSFYRTLRNIEAQPGDIVPAVPSFDRANADANLELLGPILAKRAIANHKPRIREVTMVRLASGVQRLSMNGGRQTLQATMEADSRVRGYRRVLSGSGCDWCRRVANRGTISKTEPFPAHSGCGCSSEPVFISEQS